MKSSNALKNNPEQLNENLKELEKLGIHYVSSKEFQRNREKYKNGIGLVASKNRNIKGFLHEEKRSLIFFIVIFISGLISTFLFIGGPVTYSGPLGILMGYSFIQIWKYKKYKKAFPI